MFPARHGRRTGSFRKTEILVGQLNAALDLARKGFRVFPIQPYGKKPAIDAFQVLATTDEAQIRSWWIHPLTGYETENNVGVYTGDMLVVDVDVRKTPDALNNYYALGGTDQTLTVRTPTGGYHFYFRSPPTTQQVEILPGVDTRAQGGYVLGPGSYTDPQLSGDPSVHATGYYSIVRADNQALVPLGLYGRLPTARARRERRSNVELDTQNAISAAVAWLERTPEIAVEGQGGDNTTYKVCAKIVRDYGLSDEVAYKLLLDHWNGRCVPPWSPDDLWKKVQNADAYAIGDAGAARPEMTFGAVQVPRPPDPMENHRQGFYMGNAVLPDALVKRPWAVRKLALRGDVTLFAGVGSAGKSAMTLTMLAHFAVGRNFGPYELDEAGKPLRSIVFNAEDDVMEQSRRLWAICQAYKLPYDHAKSNMMFMDSSLGDFIIASSINNTLVRQDIVLDYFIQTCQTEKADLIVMDPLASVHTCKEGDNGDMHFVISVLRSLARTTNTSLWVNVHVRKGASADGEKGNADDIRGATALVNGARIAVTLSRPTDDDVKTYDLANARRSFVRLDDAKANLYATADKAVLWAQLLSVRAPTGDLIGVPTLINIESRETFHHQKIALLLATTMQAKNVGSIKISEAVTVLAGMDPVYRPMLDQQGGLMKVRRMIEMALVSPVVTEIGLVQIHLDADGNKRITLQ